jgi:hypothetical protein
MTPVFFELVHVYRVSADAVSKDTIRRYLYAGTVADAQGLVVCKLSKSCSLAMFLFPLYSIARFTWALRLRGFIARRAYIVSESLMLIMASPCVCTVGALWLCG